MFACETLLNLDVTCKRSDESGKLHRDTQLAALLFHHRDDSVVQTTRSHSEENEREDLTPYSFKSSSWQALHQTVAYYFPW